MKNIIIPFILSYMIFYLREILYYYPLLSGCVLFPSDWL